MSLTRFDPWAGSTDVLDPCFDPMMMTTRMRNPATMALRKSQENIREFAPILSADIIEGPTDFHVHCDLPGVVPEDLDVTIANGVLTIKAERRQTHEEDSGFTHKIERNFGRVQRAVPVPLRADADSADAKFANGVLTISFRKHEGALGGRKLLIA